MIEKYLRKKITRTDLEKRMLEGSLEAEYAKYTGKKETDSLLLVKPIAPKTEDGETEN
jgi:penicillin-binding protein 2